MDPLSRYDFGLGGTGLGTTGLGGTGLAGDEPASSIINLKLMDGADFKLMNGGYFKLMET